MNTYKRHRFPPDIISYAVWLYHRFNPSNRDVEDRLAERGISVSYGVAHRELMPDVIHNTARYANNRAEHYRNLRTSAFKEWKAAVA